MPVWRAATSAVLFFGDKNLANVARVVTPPTRDSVGPPGRFFRVSIYTEQSRSFFVLCCPGAIWAMVARPYD
jgi:hypothetical protein